MLWEGLTVEGRFNFECVQHHFRVWSRGLTEKGESSWAPAALCFLTLGAMWPAAACSWYHYFPAGKDCTKHTLLSLPGFLQVFCPQMRKVIEAHLENACLPCMRPGVHGSGVLCSDIWHARVAGETGCFCRRTVVFKKVQAPWLQIDSEKWFTQCHVLVRQYLI